MLQKRDICKEKSEIYFTQFIKVHSKQALDLTAKGRTIKLAEENIRRISSWPWGGWKFLKHNRRKYKQIKTPSKLKTSCSHTVKRMQTTDRNKISLGHISHQRLVYTAHTRLQQTSKETITLRKEKRLE